jgi:hypothetical protein
VSVHGRTEEGIFGGPGRKSLSPRLRDAAQQTVAEHGEDNHCDYDGGPISLESKGRHGNDHAGDRKGSGAIFREKADEPIFNISLRGKHCFEGVRKFVLCSAEHNEENCMEASWQEPSALFPSPAHTILFIIHKSGGGMSFNFG